MNTITKTWSVPAILVVMALSAIEAKSQTFYALGSDKTTGAFAIWRALVSAPAGAAKIVFNTPAAFPENECFDVDLRTGHIITASKPSATSNISIYRNQIIDIVGVPTAFSSLLLTIPNTANSSAIALYREVSGAFLLLHSKDPNSPSQDLDNSIHRIGLGTAGAIALEVVCDDRFATGVQWGLNVNDISSDKKGNIYLNSSVPNSKVYGLSPVGGVPNSSAGGSLPFQNPGMLTMCAEAALDGTLYVGGMQVWSFFHNTLVSDFGTGIAHYTYAGIRDFHREASGLMLMIDELPGGSDVWRITPTTATTTTYPTAPLWMMPASDRFWKITIDDAARSGLYGSPCATSSNEMPLISQSGQPTINFLWGVNLEMALANINVSLYLGVEIPPLLISADCVLYNSAAIFVQTVTNGAGDATLVIPIPNDPTLVGTKVFSQWLVPDGVSFALSGAMASTVQ